MLMLQLLVVLMLLIFSLENPWADGLFKRLVASSNCFCARVNLTL